MHKNQAPIAIIAIDQGTTSTRVMAFESSHLRPILTEQLEFTQYFPATGQVEHDLNEIWDKTKLCLEKICIQLKEKNFTIACIGITNQRETIGFWDRTNGVPLTRALVWQDRRTSDFCKDNREDFASKWKQKCGLPLDPYFSGTKIAWVLENDSAVKNFVKNNSPKLSIGTIDSFLLFQLTKGESFCTDATNASRTLLLELHDKNWSEGLCSFFKVNPSWLPEIKDSLGNFGKTNNISPYIPNDIPIMAMIGDQQAALFAQGCIAAGELKCTYGTGAFLLANTDSNAQISKNGLLTTVALQYQGKRQFALEGSCFIAGAAVQWLRDGLKMIKRSSDIEQLALSMTPQEVSLMQELYFLPFFTGIGAPRWIADAKATIWGLERGTTKAHIAKACLEGIALSIDDLVNALEHDLEKPIVEMRVDGGATKNKLLMKMQSLISKRTVVLPTNPESTAMGAAAGAWIALNNWPLTKIKELSTMSQKIEFNSQDADSGYYQSKRVGWKKLLDRLYPF